ncbi:nitrate reductase cytochrome c-type subunit [Vibrio cincinnatiensis]|jgi:cytochrome c-type protein NapB|uniref:Periplasmic nitrate reductase, electron transfer subunit n=1 Tax=Vibrio cincinnatiensis DSM 19608 TaxID=1123491 RepID=A0A1T4S6U8_VIBCI|nr:nitrate reductase cytochrome c-type subunit [Vibrio cincinnatiensis]MCG3723916.1 nitrate reductase cytochrome c-type subunit [Vibrio cincinnatiensis]MCG3726293.1 nitrate reductase cytochrome c-type subunit [Vibrio cincinnatiensis]MCG3733426.1 nitrate reductase cytochrome c-type subunit [Vibrio cincinnatiensis]MCG3737105.1 nitrate reductase cytochrome c-type subunit [Vibrio cincinnatiensis]MCG3740801.1 nitrate reductase cytochrome c-type subunit [Vibrio cincinnatiensis]
MKKILVGLLVLGAILTGLAKAELDTPLELSNLESLRGMTGIAETLPAEEMKRQPREQMLNTDFVYQPPLIPHDIRNYEVSLNANKCLSCHSWKNAKVMGATKISVTHFVDREDAVLADVSPRRYFCLQCHVPQTDAKPLVENRFKSVDALN